MEMGYAGVGRQLGLLYLLPYYVGMACVLPFATRPLRLCAEPALPWRKLVGITLVDFVSQAVLMEGLSSIGSGLYTVLYSSGPLWTAALAYALLRRKIGTVQRAALLLVTAGLGVVAFAPSAHAAPPDGDAVGGGAGADVLARLLEMDPAFAWGLACVLTGTALHALVYVLQEMTLVHDAPPPAAAAAPLTAAAAAKAAAPSRPAERVLDPPHLCGLIGIMGSAVIVAHASAFTLPHWEGKVRAAASSDLAPISRGLFRARPNLASELAPISLPISPQSRAELAPISLPISSQSRAASSELAPISLPSSPQSRFRSRAELAPRCSPQCARTAARRA